MLEIKNLRKVYKNKNLEDEILKGVNFKVKKELFSKSAILLGYQSKENLDNHLSKE